MKNFNKLFWLNIFAKTSLYSFYFSCFWVALCYVMPWSVFWTLIEMPLLFVPRWWVVLLLIPVVIIDFSLILKQWKRVLISLSIAWLYLNFQLPISNLWVNSAGQSLSIMSINLGGSVRNPSLMKDHIINEQLTLIAFQEAPRSEAEKIVPQGWNLHCIGQMCLASAYKLKYLNSQSRQILGGWGHLGLLYQLQINEREIYVMNLHLETPRKGFADFQFSKLNFELHTTDFVYEELNEEQKSPVSSLLENGFLNIIETVEVKDFQEINRLLDESSGLSFEDCSVWYYSAKLSGMLLSGDGKL
jgi:hypothetical protein